MKMKFRKLIAAVCAGCLLMSNISFADLPVENSQETLGQEVVQQTEVLNPSDEIQTVETDSLSEQEASEDGKVGQTNAEGNGTSGEEPTEMNDQPTVTEALPETSLPETDPQLENQPDSAEAQQEAGTQEQGSQPESQSDIPNVQPENQEEDQAEKPETQNEQQSEETKTQTESQPEDQEEDQTEQPETQNKQQSEETKTQTESQTEEPAEDQKEEPGTQPEQQAEEQESQTEPQPETQKKEEDSQEETDNGAEEAGEEENIQTIEIGGVLSGTIKSDEAYKARLIPEWDLELVFTLKVPAWGEGAAHIRLKDEEIELIRKETEDPEAQDILYTFEETVTGGETYDFILNADWEIPFTLKVERKEATEDDTTQAAGTREDVPGEISQKAETDEYDSEAATKKAGIEDDREKKTQETGAKGDTPEETPRETETGEDNPEQNDEQAEPTETVYLPAGSLEFTSPEFAVTASFADGVIPEGTTLEAEEILPGIELYEQITGITRDMITDDWNEMGDEYRVLDIRFMLDGVEIEPNGPVSVEIKFEQPIAMEEGDNLQVLHFADEDMAQPEAVDAVLEGDIVAFSSSEFSKFVITTTRSTWQESTDLSKFLMNATVSGATIQDGKYVVEAGKPYGMTLTFKENNSWQFDNDATLEYNIPNGLVIPETQQSTITINVVSAGKTYAVPATLTVNANGKLTIKIDENSESFPRLANANNVSLRAEFQVKFNGSETNIEFGNSVTKEVLIDTVDHSDAYAEKSATFDAQTGTYHYTVKVKANGNPKNVNVKDLITGDALRFNNDVQISGNSHPYITNAVGGGTKGFDYTFSEMNNGEEITITYSASLDPDVLRNADQITSDQTKNTVTVKKEGGESHNAEYSHQINFKYPQKNTQGNMASTASGDKIFSWTIDYNPLALASAAGDTVKDQISSDAAAYMKYYGDVTVKVYRHDGTLAETRSFTPSSDSNWAYRIPDTDTTPYHYVFEYNTVVDQKAIDEKGTDVILRNTAEGDGGTTRSEITVGPKENISITKEVASSNTSEITWVSHIHVPEGGLAQAVVTDTLPSIYWDNRFLYDAFKDGSLQVEGLLSGESYDTVVNQDSVVLTFYKDTGKTQTGLQGVSGGHDITIRLTTNVNSEWLQFGYDNPGGYVADHENKIGINGKEAKAKVTFAKQDIQKTGVEQPWDHNYLYTIVVSGATQEPLVIEDTFDASIMEVDTRQASHWQHFYIWGGNQYSQDDGKTRVNYSDTDNGILITANSLPRQENGELYSYYKICYFAKLKDGVDLEALAVANGGQYDLVNRAKVGDHESEFKFTTEYKALSKELLTAATAENHYAEYKITFNPKKGTLNNGNPITLKDTMNNHLSIDHSSVRIATDPAGAEVSYSFSGEKDASGISTGGTVGTYTIPDETSVVITYRAMVIGIGNVTYSNTVSANGKTKQVTNSVDMSSSGGGSASQLSIKAVKVDGYDGSKKLAGVQFRLSSANGMSLYPPNHEKAGTTSEIITTDENGILDISYEKYGFSLVENEKYYLEEIDPPNDYMRITFPYQFTLTEEMDKVDWDNYIYFSGETFQIKNWPLEGLIVEKSVDSDDEDDLNKKFTFKVSILNTDGSVDTSINNTYGDEMKFENGVATFQLKNKEQMSAWNMPPSTKFKVEEIDADGFTVSTTVGETMTSGASYTGVTSAGGYTLVTFTNAKPKTGSLKLKKLVTVNSDPTTGTLADDDYIFTIQGTGDNASVTKTVTVKIEKGSAVSAEGGTFGTDGYVEVTDLMSGDYTITESAATNHTTLTSITGGKNESIDLTNRNVTVTVTAGQKGSDVAAVGMAAFTNNLDTGKLTIQKEVTVNGAPVNDTNKTLADGTYTFTVEGPDNYTGSMDLTISNGVSTSDTLTDLIPGTYTIKEIDPGNGTSLVKLDGQGDDGSWTVQVAGGKNATVNAVTFKNNIDVGSLIIKKNVQVNGTGTSTTDADGTYNFILTAPDGTTTTHSITITNGASNTVTITNLKPGKYTVTEDLSQNPAGMSIEGSANVTKDVYGGSTSTIETFEFTNNKTVVGALKIQKNVTVNDNPVTDAVKNLADGDYTFRIIGIDTENDSYSGSATIHIKNGVSGTAYVENLIPGNYRIAEDTPTNGTCLTGNNDITVKVVGNTTKATEGLVTANFTNNINVGGLKIEKKLTENGGTTLSNNMKSRLAGTYTFAIFEDQNCTKPYMEGDAAKTVSITIGEDGAAKTSEEITNMPVKNYWIQETSPQNGSAPTTNPVSITVEKGKSGDAAVIVTVTNNIETGNLSVSKTVTGNAGDPSKKFNFTVTINDINLNGTYGDMKFRNGVATLSLSQNDGTKTATGLPAGLGYTVVEQTDSDYTVSTSSGLTGTIPGNNGTAAASVTNRREAYGTLTISKASHGNDINRESFEFTVTLKKGSETGEPVRKAGNDNFDANGQKKFTVPANGSLTITGIPNGTWYSVTETSYDGYIVKGKKGNESGDEYELINRTLSGIFDVNSKNSYEKQTDQHVSFQNIRNTYGGLSVTKTLIGERTGKEFEFTVTLDDPAINGNYGEMEFKNGVATFRLKGGETKTAIGLENGLGYAVTEKSYAAEGYTTSMSNNADSTIRGTVTGLQNISAITVHDDNKVTVTNTEHKGGDLVVSKTVTGNSGEKNKSFTFNVTLLGAQASITGDYTGTLAGSAHTFIFTKGACASFTLKDGEEAVIKGLPPRTAYQVTETAEEGYVTYVYNAAGALIQTRTYNWTTTDENGSPTVSAFVNEKNLYGGLKVAKVTGGNDGDKKSWFAFQIVLNDKTINGTYGDAVFVNGVSDHNTDASKEKLAAAGVTEDKYLNSYPESARQVKENGQTTGKVDPEKTHGWVIVSQNCPLIITGLPAGVEYTVTEDTYSSQRYVQTATGVKGTVAGISTDPSTITEAHIIDKANVATATNVRNSYNNLTIRKLISEDSNLIDNEKEFKFKVTLKDENNAAVSATYGEGENAITFTNGEATVTVKNGESVIISQIPIKYTYTVQEIVPNGYAVTSYMHTDKNGDLGGVQTDNNGADYVVGMIDNNGHVITATNKYASRGTGEIKVKKVVNGVDQWGTGYEFTFTLSPVDNAPMPPNSTITIKNTDADHTVSFGVIPFTKAGQYTYKVKEARGSIGGIAYDESEHTVTLNVVDDKKGHLTAADGDTLIKTETITNTYSTSGKGEIKVQKVLDGRAWTSSDTFTFTIQGTSGAPMPENKSITITNSDADHIKSFGEIEFTGAGTYTYLIKEKKESIPGITYSESSQVVTIKLQSDGYGNLIAIDGTSLFRTVQFSNTYSASGEGEISVQKDLQGRDWNDSDKFSFTISAADGTPMPENNSITITKADANHAKSFGKITFKKAGTYTYMVKETHGGFGGMTYDTSDHKVTISVVDDGKGHLVAAPNSQITQAVKITNTYATSGRAVISATKKLEDGDTWPEGGKVTFTLTALTDDAPMPSNSERTKILTGPGTVSFGTISLKKEHDGKTYHYKIVEATDGFGGGWSKSDDITVTLTSKDNGLGKMSATLTYSPTDYTITNSYKAIGSTSIQVTKKLAVGDTWPENGKVTFTLTPETTGAPMPDDPKDAEQTLSGPGIATFGPITLQESMAGKTYLYTITETGTFGKGWHAAKTVTAEMTVTDDGKGILKAEINYTPSDAVIENRSIDKPSFEKKIADINDSKETAHGPWQDSADYDIGDLVPYKLTAVLPLDVTDYYRYHIAFCDTMEKTLKFREITAVTLTAGGKTTVLNASDYAFAQTDDHDFTVTLIWEGGKDADGRYQRIADASLNGAVVNVYFNGELLPNANLGSKGNINTAYLRYSSNPSLVDAGTSGEGDTDGKKPSDEEDKTPDDIVIAFTYRIEISKTDVDGNALSGASFRLEKINENGTAAVGSYTAATAGNVFSFTGLDDGLYRLTETTVPKGYYPIEPIEFEVTADHETVWNVSDDSTRNTVLKALKSTQSTTQKNSGEIILSFDATQNALIGTVKNEKIISVSVRKIWDDRENHDGLRPKSVTFTLYADGVEVRDSSIVLDGIKDQTDKTFRESEAWTALWTGLHQYANGKEILYTVKETSADEHYMIDYGKDATGTALTYAVDGGKITNRHIPNSVSVSIKKVWKDDNNRDGKRPLALTVRLKADGEVIATETLNATNNWTLMKNGLRKYDASGKIITYSWEEAVPKGYTLESTETSGTLTTLTNVYTPEKTSVSAKKVWNDNGNAGKTRPESIKVQLFANGKAEGKPVTLNDSNGWAASWTNLNKFKDGNLIRYTVEEVSIPVDYTSKVSGSAADGFVITNSIELASMVIEKNFNFGDKKPEDLETRIEVPVQKVWVDFDNRDKNRPDSITVHLYADGERVATASLTEDGGWKNTFRDLPKYNRETFEEIVYTISEDPVAYYKTVINHFTIVNQYEPVLVDLSVSKIWDDDGNDMKIRPKSIHVTLSNGTSVLLSASNGWTATITELPTVVNGQPVDYSWTEQEVPGYRQSDKDTAGDMTVFTNKVVKLVKVPADQPQPKVPGAIWYVFEEYDTALGGDILINHVGDCFD